MYVYHMSVSGSTKPLHLSKNTPSFPLIQCQALSHTGLRFTAWLCLWAALGMAAGHHIIPHNTRAQMGEFQPWPLHFSDSSAAWVKPMCGLKNDQCGTGRGMKCVCPFRGLSFQSPHHPLWPLLSDSCQSWGSSQLKLYQQYAWWFINNRTLGQTFKVWALWAGSRKTLKGMYAFYSCRIYGIKSVEQVNVVHVLHRGQGFCALEDQAFHSTALLPKLQTYLTAKNTKNSMMAGSRSKPGDKVSRIRTRDIEHMLLTEGWHQRELSGHHLYQKSFVVS